MGYMVRRREKPIIGLVTVAWQDLLFHLAKCPLNNSHSI